MAALSRRSTRNCECIAATCRSSPWHSPFWARRCRIPPPRSGSAIRRRACRAKPTAPSTWRRRRLGSRTASPISPESGPPRISTARRAAEKRPATATTSRPSRYMANFGADFPEGLPYQPWQLPIVKERTENLAIDDPHIRCLPDFFLRAYGLPHMLKFVHTPDLLVVLNEMNAGYRQVFTDARPLPDEPAPAWQGYSSAKWAGDTLDHRHDRNPRRHLDRLERQRRDRGGQDPRGDPPPGLRPPRNQGHRRRSEGLYEAVDGHTSGSASSSTRS